VLWNEGTRNRLISQGLRRLRSFGGFDRAVGVLGNASQGQSQLQGRPVSPETSQGKIRWDELIVLKSAVSRQTYADLLRRIVALVEVDRRAVEMVFLSNNLEWSAESIVEIYRRGNSWILPSCQAALGCSEPIPIAVHMMTFLRGPER
jgi:hypothetical protein